MAGTIRTALRTCNPPEGVVPSGIAKWLVITRACVFSMTLTSGLIALLLALLTDLPINWGAWALSTFGILLAHAANNIMNDLLDLQGGVDTKDYPRALYAPHPVLSGWISKRGLINAAIFVNIVGVVIGLTLTWWRGLPILWFALAGFALSFFYTGPPLRLKRIGLGEPTVLLVWGPLMIGGTFFAATGTVTWPVILASIPYGITVTSVLMGKHLDKFEFDKPKGVHTLPVVLGYDAAKVVTMGMWIASMIVIAVLVVQGTLSWIVFVLSLFALPRMVKVWRLYRAPKPTEPPEQFKPTWPLYYVSLAFHYNRLAGGMFMLGLLVNVLLLQFFPEFYASIDVFPRS